MSYQPRFDPRRTMQVTGCLVLFSLLLMTCVLPFLLINVATSALENLHLSRTAALLVVIGIVVGSGINLPIVRYPLDHFVEVPVFEPFAGWSVMPQVKRMRQEMTVSVNVGGCVIPVLLGFWLLPYIFRGGTTPTLVLLIAMSANILACYRLARPIPGMGIALPFFLPALVAITTTWLGFILMGATADSVDLGPLVAPVAYVSGISGPLIGADLLNWRRFQSIGTGSVSIGGAGTWDGIVLSGILAALLA